MPYHDRKSTRLNSSHGSISYAVFCLKKKKKKTKKRQITHKHRIISWSTHRHLRPHHMSPTPVSFVSFPFSYFFFFFFFFNDTATTEIYTFPYTTLFRSIIQVVILTISFILYLIKYFMDLNSIP